MKYCIVTVIKNVVNTINLLSFFGWLVEKYAGGDDKAKKDMVLTILAMSVFMASIIDLGGRLLAVIVSVLICLRTVNIVCVQIKVIFCWWPGDGIKLAKRELTAFRRSAVLLVLNVFEVCCGYVVLYRNFGSHFKVDLPSETVYWVSYVHGSLYNMFGVGKDIITWESHFGQWVITSQNIIGWGFTVISLAVFVSLLGQFNTRDNTEKSS